MPKNFVLGEHDEVKREFHNNIASCLVVWKGEKSQTYSLDEIVADWQERMWKDNPDIRMVIDNAVLNKLRQEN